MDPQDLLTDPWRHTAGEGLNPSPVGTAALRRTRCPAGGCWGRLSPEGSGGPAEGSEGPAEVSGGPAPGSWKRSGPRTLVDVKDHPACAAFLLDDVGRYATRWGGLWCVGEELRDVCRPIAPSYQVSLDPPAPPHPHPEPSALWGGGATPGGVACPGGRARPGGGAMTEGRLQGRGEAYRTYLGGVADTYLGGVASPYLGGVAYPVENLPPLEGVWRVSCSGPPMMGDWALHREEAWRRAAGRSVSTQTSPVPSARSSFFSRAAQRLSQSRRRRRSSDPDSPGPLLYTGGFSGALRLSPPALPPGLLRAGSKVTDSPGMGKVKVMVRLCAVQGETSDPVSYLKVCARKKQLTLCEPAGPDQQGGPGPSRDPPARRTASPVLKTFAFDAVFSQDASQAEVCSGSVAEVIQSVVNGADGCIFCYGHADLGKTYTLIGRDCSTQSLGVAPTAISWLFRVMEERKEKAGGEFSVSVSAVEISGREETLSDLLAHCYSSSSSEHLLPQGEQRRPGVLLQEDPVCGSQLQNQRELRVSTAEHAAFFLDAALAARSSSRGRCDQATRRNSHLLFTLLVHQQRPEKSTKAAVAAGRSRLHLLDLGSCETGGRGGGGGAGGGTRCLSLSALGNVILALVNGAKHVPYRDSRLTMLLRQSLGNINCRTTMLAHVAACRARHPETLAVLQLASRLHRIRNHKSRYASSSSGGDSSCEEERPHPLRPLHPRTVALDPDGPARPGSDPDCSSSGEQSCDTVVYVGPGGAAVSDRELSDNESPPAAIPIVPSLLRAGAGGLRCNTFAELQERLDCIQDPAPRPDAAPRPDPAPRGPDATAGVGSCADNPKEVWARPGQVAGRPGVPAPEEAVREGVYLGGTAPRPSASPSLPRGLQAAPRAPGSRAGGGADEPPAERGRARVRGAGPREVCPLRAVLGRRLDQDFLRTTVTLQQPVELNGEDELVFTVVEDLPLPLAPDADTPAGARGLSGAGSGRRPVSIIGSISDEYDAYLTHLGEGAGPVSALHPPHEALSQQPSGLWRREHGYAPGTRGPAQTPRLDPESLPVPSLPNPFSLDPCPGTRPTALNSHPAPPRSPAGTRSSSSPEPPRAGPKGSRTRAGSLPPHASLPRRAKLAPTAAQEDRRQDPRQEDLWGPPGPVEGERRRPAGHSHSVPRPSKTQGSSSSLQRGGDGCERNRGDPLGRAPRLTRGATTLGTISGPQGSSESMWEHAASPGPGSVRFSSLGKRSSGHRTSRILKSGSGGLVPAAGPVGPAGPGSQDPRPRAAAAASWRSSSPRALLPEEDLPPRHRADSLNHKSSASRGDPGSLRMTSSLKRRGGSGEREPVVHYGMSLERSGGLSSREQGGADPGGRSTPPAPGPGQARPGSGSRMSSEPGTAGRAANSRVSELAAAGGGAGLPSPYSKVTAPRPAQRHSSGVASDNSSVLSGELPPAMGRTALFYHSGGSSGYESMRRDSETASSARDSMSDEQTRTRGRAGTRTPKKRGNGLQRRRLIPAPLPDSSSLGRRAEGPRDRTQQPFEITVYHIDPMDPVQRKRQEQTFQDVEKGLQYFNTRLRLVERRQQQITELRARRDRLRAELHDAKNLLMAPPGRWSPDYDAEQHLDQESQEYLEVLVRTTAELEDYVNVCKSHLMMETCFDVTTAKGGATRRGL